MAAVSPFRACKKSNCMISGCREKGWGGVLSYLHFKVEQICGVEQKESPKQDNG